MCVWHVLSASKSQTICMRRVRSGVSLSFQKSVFMPGTASLSTRAWPPLSDATSACALFRGSGGEASHRLTMTVSCG